MRTIKQVYQVVVVGGGISGLCAAVAAAREGARTALLHARPVPGGNASSEIRMHICGADDHMSRPNARETGLVEELQLRNKNRNPTASYPIFDSVLWEMASLQPNLTLYLNTVMDRAEAENGHIRSVSAYQQTTETRYDFSADIFIDATGDGLLSAMAGVPFAVGRESRDVYGESFAPLHGDRCTMGNSLMFHARDAGHPVPFVRPSWARRFSEDELRLRDHREVTSGYWWVELGGGEKDVTDDYELLRDELTKTVWGIWDHIKNGGDHGAENMDLDWVGFLPGKRESRRILGEYVLTQTDCEEGRRFPDAVAYGGWPMDVHAVEGFLNPDAPPTEWIHLKDVYTIPYRCFYSRHADNLFFCGRIISASHMAFASARVMATCGVGGQAVGTAAAMAVREKKTPHALAAEIGELQRRLTLSDCWIPGVEPEDPEDLAPLCRASANAFLPGCEPDNLLRGPDRTVAGQSNAWSAPLADAPEVTLTLPSPRAAGNRSHGRYQSFPGADHQHQRHGAGAAGSRHAP